MRRAVAVRGASLAPLLYAVSLAFSCCTPVLAQTRSVTLDAFTHPHAYLSERASSYDRSGRNRDFRTIAPGQTLTILDADGPGEIRHLWFTVWDDEPFFLKKLVLRMYWDGEASPSVLTPLGDFFGLGLGRYVEYQSLPLVVAPQGALNSFFPMPFRKHALITVTNEGTQPVRAFYYQIDYRRYRRAQSVSPLYFHAEYRQAVPARGNPQAVSDVDGKNNYVWLDARGRGQFAGVTMSVVLNANGWWGEGNDMFFVDGARMPTIEGTGTEDAFGGAWDFGDRAFADMLFGEPVAGTEKAGSAWSVYRFYAESPIAFTRSLRASIEHGAQNDRSDDFYSVAYWYQAQPHLPLPALPPVADRIPPIATSSP